MIGRTIWEITQRQFSNLEFSWLMWLTSLNISVICSQLVASISQLSSNLRHSKCNDASWCHFQSLWLTNVISFSSQAIQFAVKMKNLPRRAKNFPKSPSWLIQNPPRTTQSYLWLTQLPLRSHDTLNQKPQSSHHRHHHPFSLPSRNVFDFIIPWMFFLGTTTEAAKQ